jgi:hypothetical protein
VKSWREKKLYKQKWKFTSDQKIPSCFSQIFRNKMCQWWSNQLEFKGMGEFPPFFFNQWAFLSLIKYIHVIVRLMECMLHRRGRRGSHCIVVGFTTNYTTSAYPLWCCELESRSGQGVQHYVIKFVVDLRLVGGFLQVLRFPPPIKLTATI